MIGACCIISALGFTGFAHEGYSLLNHMISELGMKTESPLAWVFNMGLIIGSPLALLFIVQTRTVIPSRIGNIGRVIGIAAGIGGFFVGIFPADIDLPAHDIAAMTFFFGGAVTVIVFSVAIARQQNIRLGKWLCIFGIGVAACFTAFLIDAFFFSTGPNLNDASSFSQLAPLRPPVFWADAFLEWLPLIGVLAWLLLAALDSLKRNRA